MFLIVKYISTHLEKNSVFSLLIGYPDLNFKIVKKMIKPDMQTVMMYG